ncbi:MAG: ABC-F family ATP-binding cassette domain-containing protein [Epsilonproteobacteria bacterium]|nr:ABC-F family ATP-binding cassette domain-containing protein [Campylobacterota bacterium]
MIQLVNLSKSFGAQRLFNNLNLQLSPGQKIGLIGRNGSGKSTLFKIILKEESFDEGELIIPKNYKIGTLRQHLHFTQKTVREECAQVLSEEEQYHFYKVEKILFGLGFSSEDLEADPQSFSGGYQIRINLAKLLATEPHMLLLDEPTNYLDILSLRWLQRFIREFKGEVILITHDRAFMDSVTTHTMGLQRKGVHIIEGDTHKYEKTLALQDETYEKTRQNQEKKRKELEEFVARNKARASTAALAQSKQKALDKMEEMQSLESEANLSFHFNYKETPAKITLSAENLGFGYKEDTPLFKDLSFTLESGKCLAIIGKNGKGKSTLLNYLAKELPHQNGEITLHPSTAIAHFGQTNIERLNTKNSITEEINSVVKSMPIAQIRSICGTMMFSGELADKKIEVLSGGERSRVMLGKIIATPSNLLLLDEPTNHLDMQSIDALCDAIERFQGSTIMVTHSEMLLRRLADALIIFHQGGATYFDGNYDDFLEKIGWEEEGVEKPKKERPKLNQKEQKKQRSQLIQARSKESGPFKKEITFCEEQIMDLEERLDEENAKLTHASNSGDNAAIIELSQNIAKLNSEIEALFERLEVASESLEEILSKYEALLEALI